MSGLEAKITVSNHHDCPHVIWVEPWAEDFTLLPKEEFEVRAVGSTVQPSFKVVESKRHTQVYVDPIEVRYEVLQHGRVINGGHNRQAAIDSGIERETFYGEAD
jgi:hypothetical protein